jgi:hypothetical protein
VTIPSSVTSIGTQAFYSCSSLATVYENANTPPTLPSGSNAFASDAAGLLIHVPSGTVATYQAATGWSQFASQIVSP